MLQFRNSVFWLSPDRYFASFYRGGRPRSDFQRILALPGAVSDPKLYAPCQIGHFKCDFAANCGMLGDSHLWRFSMAFMKKVMYFVAATSFGAFIWAILRAILRL